MYRAFTDWQERVAERSGALDPDDGNDLDPN
jgi:hypothetical protein